jgi:hypothetical protein
MSLHYHKIRIKPTKNHTLYHTTHANFKQQISQISAYFIPFLGSVGFQTSDADPHHFSYAAPTSDTSFDSTPTPETILLYKGKHR